MLEAWSSFYLWWMQTSCTRCTCRFFSQATTMTVVLSSSFQHSMVTTISWMDNLGFFFFRYVEGGLNRLQWERSPTRIACKGDHRLRSQWSSLLRTSFGSAYMCPSSPRCPYRALSIERPPRGDHWTRAATMWLLLASGGLGRISSRLLFSGGFLICLVSLEIYLIRERGHLWLEARQLRCPALLQSWLRWSDLDYFHFAVNLERWPGKEKSWM